MAHFKMKALLHSANLHLAHITLLMANASRGATVCVILPSPYIHLLYHTASHTLTGVMPPGYSASVWSASRGQLLHRDPMGQLRQKSLEA